MSVENFCHSINTNLNFVFLYLYLFLITTKGDSYIIKAAALVKRMGGFRLATAYSVGDSFFCDMSLFHHQMAPLWH